MLRKLSLTKDIQIFYILGKITSWVASFKGKCTSDEDEERECQLKKQKRQKQIAGVWRPWVVCFSGNILFICISSEFPIYFFHWKVFYSTFSFTYKPYIFLQSVFSVSLSLSLPPLLINLSPAFLLSTLG